MKEVLPIPLVLLADAAAAQNLPSPGAQPKANTVRTRVPQSEFSLRCRTATGGSGGMGEGGRPVPETRFTCLCC